MLGLGGGTNGRLHTRTVSAGCKVVLSFLTRETLLRLSKQHSSLEQRLRKFAVRRRYKDRHTIHQKNIEKIMPSEDAVRRQFQKIDSNNDGSVDRQEIESAINSFGLKLNSDEIDSLMSQASATGDEGKITEASFVRLIETLKDPDKKVRGPARLLDTKPLLGSLTKRSAY